MMTSTEMNKENYHLGGDFKIFLMSMINKTQNIILKNDSKGLILGTDSDQLFSFLEFGDPTARVHPPCHSYLVYY